MTVNGLADLLLRHARQRRMVLFACGVFALLLTGTTLRAMSWRTDLSSSEVNGAAKNGNEDRLSSGDDLTATEAIATPVDPGVEAVRHPLAIMTWADDPSVVVANRCGTLSCLSPLSNETDDEVRSETRIAKQLVKAVGLPAAGEGLALGKQPNALIWFHGRNDDRVGYSMWNLGDEGSDLSVSPSGRNALISHRWDRKTQVLELGFDAAGHRFVETRGTWEFDREPGVSAWVDEHRFVVAEAFGNRLSLLDVREPKQRSVLTLDGHNIQGLLWHEGRQTLYASYSKFDELRPLTEVAIEFGDAMKHRVATISLDAFVGVDAEAQPKVPFIELGFTGLAATDPGALATVDQDQIAVVLEGVGEISLIDLVGRYESRIAVKRGPIAIARLPADWASGTDRPVLGVVNRFDDQVSLIDVPRQQAAKHIALGKSGARTSEQRGEQLFFDATLARDRWMSCHTCHTRGHTNGLLADTLSDGGHGNPKRVLSLLGVGTTGPWSWTGDKENLEEQVAQSVRKTMHGLPLSEAQVNDLTAFVKHLERPPLLPVTQAQKEVNNAELGQKLFKELGCADCHSPSTDFTSPDRYDVDLVDELGIREFNPPSLRSISRRQSYFHDGRAAELNDVFRNFKHQLPRTLSDDDLEALLAYLRSL